MKDNMGRQRQPTTCRTHNLGLVGYDRAMQLQDRLVSARLIGEIPDTILLLQHPPLFTIGTSGGEENITAAKATLVKERLPIIHTDRGGNITCHGQGQLVGYPIFDLQNKGKDLHLYVRNLEETIIRTLHEFSIPAFRNSRYPGIWVYQRKICSLGIRVRHWVTKHGFALNVNNDLKHFSYIYPCGITNGEVTSMSQVLGHQIMIRDVIPYLLKSFSQVFRVSVN